MKISTGIASTTHIDKHNERMAKSALNGMAEQINEKYIPQLIDHDWNLHFGVVLYGEVFQLEDGEYALGVVSGIFEAKEEKETFKTGKTNNVWRDYKRFLNIDELSRLSGQKHQKKQIGRSAQELSIADLLETYLDSTQLTPDGTVYKTKRFIAATRDLSIEIYPKDHFPYQPHFHVISKQRRINARFDIETLSLINMKQGTIQGKDIKKIQSLFRAHPEYLEKLKSEHNRLK